MLGTKKHHVLKTKAGETGVLVAWATALASEFQGSIPYGGQLVEAGGALLNFMEVLKSEDLVMPRETCQYLLELAIQHCTLMDEAKIPGTPKCHLFVHLVLRIPRRNP